MATFDKTHPAIRNERGTLIDILFLGITALLAIASVLLTFALI